MPGDRATWGVFLLVTFLCTSKEKLPARPQGEWKLCTAASEKALDSGVRRNDEQRVSVDFSVSRTKQQKYDGPGQRDCAGHEKWNGETASAVDEPAGHEDTEDSGQCRE